MNHKYNALFSPIQINNMMLRNRIIISPMGIIKTHKIISSTDYGQMSGWDRSLSGAALVHLAPLGDDKFNKYELDVTKEQINVAKQDGCKVACEVEFASFPDKDGYVYGPDSGIRYDGFKMKAFDKEHMDSLKKEIVDFSVKCKKIGFDAITLHWGHDCLLSQFLSPVWNTRNDEYGGNVENRGRYPLEVIKAVREAVGKDYPIILRVSRQLIVKETYSEDDMLQFIKSTEGLVDMVNISCGMDVYHAANVHAVPTIFEKRNYNADFAKRVKENTNLVVGLVGAVMNYKEANKLIEDGYTDCCFFGRSTIADPYWPKKVLNGNEEDVVPCIRCNHCYHIATNHWNTQCSVNPRFRRENRLELTSPIETTLKNIVVIGGGVAGMVAALAAEEVGHNVTLIEKENRLGGLLNWAAKGPFKVDLADYLQYLINQVNKSNINVMLNTLATKELVESLYPNRLIVAIGSKARQLNIPGNEKMMDCLDAIDNVDKIGERVVIIGGGSIGCEQGLELSLLNKDVTIVEMMSDIALNGNMLYRIGLKQHMDKQDNLHVLTNAKALEVKDDRVVIEVNGEVIELPYDTVINSVGRISNFKEAFDFYNITQDTVMIGDCERVGSIVDATNIASFVGKSI